MQTSSRSKEDLTKLIVKLGSFAQAILLAQLQFSYLQRFKIRALKLSKCYHANELFRWIENLRLYNGKSLILPPTDLCISTDVGGGTCQGISTARLVIGGTEGSLQHTRVEGSAFSHTDFYKIQNSL